MDHVKRIYSFGVCRAALFVNYIVNPQLKALNKVIIVC